METWILVGIVLFLIFLIYSSHCDCRRGFSVGGRRSRSRRGRRNRGRRSRREGRRNRGRGSRRRSGRVGDNTDPDNFSMETEIKNRCPPNKQSNCQRTLKNRNCWNYNAKNWACGVTKDHCKYPSPFIWCSNSPSPPGPPPPSPPSPPPGPPSSNSCVNPDYKGLCIDDYSATLNPYQWFGGDASRFTWPLTNQPIQVIRTYNWKAREWVIWALDNNIKVLIGFIGTDFIGQDDKNYLKKNKNNIIGIVYWNEPKYNPTNHAPNNILKEELPDVPRMISYTHRNVNDYNASGVSDNVLAVNIYGLYAAMCCCDGCDCCPETDQSALEEQLPWNKGTILINSFDAIFDKNDFFKSNPNMKLWITETGWSSWPQGCFSADCHEQQNPHDFRRKIKWSNNTNLSRFYKEFLKYDNTDSTKTPEYIFYFCLSDTYGTNYGPLPEKMGLYTKDKPPKLKIT